MSRYAKRPRPEPTSEDWLAALIILGPLAWPVRWLWRGLRALGGSMNWHAWRCWFRAHDYAYQEVGLDPKEPEVSARFLNFLADQFDGNRIGVNRCRRCGHIGKGGLVIRDVTGGTVAAETYIEQRYRRDLDRLAQTLENQHDGEVRINVPSLRAEPIPLRDAFNTFADLDIAASKSTPAIIKCWQCHEPLPLSEEMRGRAVRCEKCGTRQKLPS